MLTKEQIQHNIDCFKVQMSRFIDFSDNKALMVNNADWLWILIMPISGRKWVSFLREPHADGGML